MNIVEAYIKKKSQLIILVSGFSGSGKTTLAREIERDFKINILI
jgi:uridine kinase